jgi:hypothetical protein
MISVLIPRKLPNYTPEIETLELYNVIWLVSVNTLSVRRPDVWHLATFIAGVCKHKSVNSSRVKYHMVLGQQK